MVNGRQFLRTPNPLDRNWLFAILPAMASLLFSSCDDTSLDVPYENLPPRTTISGAPRPFSRTTYTVDLKWYGEDPDGEVIGYQYAWDDTTDWFDIAVTGSTFSINADTCCIFDTLEISAGRDSLAERFFRFHVFFLRALDNNNEPDPTPAYIAFNSVNVAPYTRFTLGPTEGDRFTGSSVTFAWEGTDPDRPEKQVVAYEYFHATNGDLKRKYGYVSELEGGQGITRDFWSRLDWIRVRADTTRLTLRNLAVTSGDPENKRHFFFVRSIDEAGAAEQIPVRDVNYTEWGVIEKPIGFVIIRSNLMGSRISGILNPPLGEVFENTPLFFSWMADLRSYYGTPNGYQYSYDNFIWSPWSRSNISFPDDGELFTPTRGRHTLFVRVRDDAGSIFMGRFPFEVFSGPDPDVKSILHWNDFYVETDPDFYPQPSDFLSFWADSLLRNVSEVQQFNPRVNPAGFSPPIRRMSDASTIILSTDSWGEERTYISALHSIGKNPIWSYVEAGGNLLIVGFRPSWNFLPDNKVSIVDSIITPDPCLNWSQPISCGGRMIWHSPIVVDSIPHPLYEYCGIETTWLNNAEDYLWSARSLQPAFLPDLVIDTTRSRLFRTGRGLPECEHLTARDDREIVPLYQFCRGANPRQPNGEDPDQCDDPSKPVGLYIPSDGQRGNVVYLGMPLYYFHTTQVKRTVEAIMVNLFGETLR